MVEGAKYLDGMVWLNIVDWEEIFSLMSLDFDVLDPFPYLNQ